MERIASWRSGSCSGPWTCWAWLFESELLTNFKIRTISHFKKDTNYFQLVLKDLAGLGAHSCTVSSSLPFQMCLLSALTHPHLAPLL